VKGVNSHSPIAVLSDWNVVTRIALMIEIQHFDGYVRIKNVRNEPNLLD
jgi:hypothetical protein